MAKPFKFRYVNEIAGAFTGMIVIVLVAGLVFVGRAQHWFEPVRHYTVQMPPEGYFGIKPGAEVRMLGTIVGAVDSVHSPTDSGKITASIHVKADFGNFVREDSSAIIHIPIALADPFLEIKAETKGRMLTDQGTIIASPETGASDAMNQTLMDFRTQTLPRVDALLDRYTAVASDLHDPNGPLMKMLTEVNTATAKLNRDDNGLGRLINNKQLAEDISQTVAKLNSSVEGIRLAMVNVQLAATQFPSIATGASSQVARLPVVVDQIQTMLAQVNLAVKNLQQATVQLPAMIESLKQASEQLPDVMSHAQQTLVELQSLTKGMEGLPFVRNNVDHTPDTAGPLRPSDTGGPP